MYQVGTVIYLCQFRVGANSTFDKMQLCPYYLSFSLLGRGSETGRRKMLVKLLTTSLGGGEKRKIDEKTEVGEGIQN